MTYLSNVLAWLRGFRHLGEITYKEGWTPRKFLPLYLLDYGFCTVGMAGPVVSVSWYLGEYFNLPGHHFANAGRPLWGTERSPPWVRVVVPIIWVFLGLWIYVA